MPIFEATPRKSNLTAQQIKEAERSLFGPPPVENAGFPVQQEEKIRTIDLNNPPVDPYRYQEYPRMMYLHGDGAQFLIVQNDAQRQVAEGRGYTAEVAVSEPEPETAPLEAGDEYDLDDDEGEDEQLSGISGPIDQASVIAENKPKRKK